MTTRDQAIIPLVIGRGHLAYLDAKRWIEANYPHLTPQQYAEVCRLAARLTGV